MASDAMYGYAGRWGMVGALAGGSANEGGPGGEGGSVGGGGSAHFAIDLEVRGLEGPSAIAGVNVIQVAHQ